MTGSTSNLRMRYHIAYCHSECRSVVHIVLLLLRGVGKFMDLFFEQNRVGGFVVSVPEEALIVWSAQYCLQHCDHNSNKAPLVRTDCLGGESMLNEFWSTFSDGSLNFLESCVLIERWRYRREVATCKTYGSRFAS
jgi:hypothetical protein